MGFRIIDRNQSSSSAAAVILSLELFEAELQRLAHSLDGDEPTSVIFQEKIRQMRQRLTTAPESTPTADETLTRIQHRLSAKHADPGAAITGGTDIKRLLNLLED